MSTISTGRCQNMFTANKGKEANAISGLLSLGGEGRSGKGVVDYHDVQHAGDHGVHPAQFEELVAGGVDGVEVLLGRRLFKISDFAPDRRGMLAVPLGFAG